jgi:hypothetical protein
LPSGTGECCDLLVALVLLLSVVDIVVSWCVGYPNDDRGVAVADLLFIPHGSLPHGKS